MKLPAENSTTDVYLRSAGVCPKSRERVAHMKKLDRLHIVVHTNLRKERLRKEHCCRAFSIVSCNPAELQGTSILFNLPLRRKSSADGASGLFWRTTLGEPPGRATRKMGFFFLLLGRVLVRRNLRSSHIAGEKHSSICLASHPFSRQLL